MITRDELWNGNREQWRNLLTLNPETNIVLWAWTQLSKYHQRAIAEEPTRASAGTTDGPADITSPSATLQTFPTQPGRAAALPQRTHHIFVIAKPVPDRWHHAPSCRQPRSGCRVQARGRFDRRREP